MKSVGVVPGRVRAIAKHCGGESCFCPRIERERLQVCCMPAWTGKCGHIPISQDSTRQDRPRDGGFHTVVGREVLFVRDEPNRLVHHSTSWDRFIMFLKCILPEVIRMDITILSARLLVEPLVPATGCNGRGGAEPTLIFFRGRLVQAADVPAGGAGLGVFSTRLVRGFCWTECSAGAMRARGLLKAVAALPFHFNRSNAALTLFSRRDRRLGR
jgi:hypothetical protein